MKYSFITTTINGREAVAGCVDSIRKAARSFPGADYEIIAVLQGCEEKTNATEVRREGDLVTVAVPSCPGLGAARNTALKLSVGDYLIFLDDDAAIADTFFKELSAAVRNHQAAAYCGRIMDPVTGMDYSACFGNRSSRPLGVTQFRYFMGSAHIVCRSVIESIGGYDPRFGAGAEFGGAEESDLFFRLLAQNCPVIYEPALVFLHPLHRDTSPEKVYKYARAVSAMLRKQMTIDPRHLAVYLSLLLDIALKSFVRTIQCAILPARYREKNKRYRFSSVLRGTIDGFAAYGNK